MPLTDLGSYVPTKDEVVLHWADVNAELGGAPATDLKLEGAFSRADLFAARDVLEALNISIEDLENGREIAAANRSSPDRLLWLPSGLGERARDRRRQP